MGGKAEIRPEGIVRRDMFGLAAAAVVAAGTRDFAAATPAVRRPSDAETGPGVPIVTKVVDTTTGRVQGLVNRGVQTFKGVRYGAAPIGRLRFMPPEKPQPTTDILDCSDYGAPAMQIAAGATAKILSDFGMQLARVFTAPSELKVQNEDCLFLNVWTPATDDGKRPVMVWIHGGGFAWGSGGQPVDCGEDLARSYDVVSVSVNHRLNLFGYLFLGEAMGDAYKTSGTVGMQDLVFALEWVRDNIANFGGDPDNVMIMGQSGGGSKVCTLLAMESAKGLFHKASIQSGATLRIGTRDAAGATTKALLAELEIAAGDIKALQNVPAPVLLAAATKSAANLGPPGAGLPGRGAAFAYMPIVDGLAITRQPFDPDAPAVSADVPILLGWVKDEMTIFTAQEPWFGRMTDADLDERVRALGPKGPKLVAAWRKLRPDYSPTYLWIEAISSNFAMSQTLTVAERKAAQGRAPVYLWYLTWETPVLHGAFRTPHTLDIPFTLNSYERVRTLVGPGPQPGRMAKQMAGAWTAFARTGNPDVPGIIPHWPAYDVKARPTMEFNLESRVVEDPGREVREILEGPA